MQFKTFTFRDRLGNVVSGADVRVYIANTSTQVKVFGEDGSELGTSDLVTDANGQSSFAAFNGEYDVVASLGAATFVIQNQLFNDPPVYATVAAFAADVTAGYTPQDGTVISAGPVQFQADSSASVAGLPVGWKPFGNVTPDHFEYNETPGTTDMTLAFRDAAAYANSIGGATIKLVSDILIKDRVRLHSNTHIDLMGYTIDASGVTVGGTIRDAAIYAIGDYGSELPLTANADKGDITLSVAGSGLVRDDMVIVGSDALFDTHRTATETAEIRFVQESDATTVTLFSPVNYAATTANNAYIQKITPVENIVIKNGNIIGPQQDEPVDALISIWLIAGKNITVTGINFVGASNADVQFVDCYAAKHHGNSHFGSEEKTELAYGVSFANATCDSSAIGNNFFNRRHCLSTNNLSAIPSGASMRGVVSRIKFSNNVIHRAANFTSSPEGAPLDTHAACDGIEILWNTVHYAPFQGINFEGRSGRIVGNEIHEAAGSTAINVVNHTDADGDIMEIDSNIIRRVTGASARGIDVSNGFIDPAQGGFKVITVSNNKVLSATGSGITVEVTNLSGRPECNVSGNYSKSDLDAIAVIGAGKLNISANTAIGGNEGLQLNDCENVVALGNIAETTSTSNRAVSCLKLQVASINGNVLKVPDGSTSQGLIVTALGGVNSEDVLIAGNTIIALGTNSGTGIVTGNGRITVGDNLVTNFATRYSLSAQTVAPISPTF